MDNNLVPVEYAETYKKVSKWDQPGGTLAKIITVVAGCATIYGLYLALPIILSLMTNAFSIACLAIGLWALVSIVTNKKFRRLISTVFFLITRKLTSLAIETDPCSILSRHVKELKEKKRISDEERILVGCLQFPDQFLHPGNSRGSRLRLPGVGCFALCRSLSEPLLSREALFGIHKRPDRDLIQERFHPKLTRNQYLVGSRLRRFTLCEIDGPAARCDLPLRGSFYTGSHIGGHGGVKFRGIITTRRRGQRFSDTENQHTHCSTSSHDIFAKIAYYSESVKEGLEK